MYEVKSIIRPERVASVVNALQQIADVPGITISVVRGIGRMLATETVTGQFGETEMAKLETVVPEQLLQAVLGAIQAGGSTGRPGDGKVFVSRVEEALNVRSGARGPSVL